MPFILEGLVTTLSPQGEPHLAPMGPIVDRELTALTLRPFRTSHTFQHLQAHGAGVFHVTDDVELLSQAAIGRVDPAPTFVPARSIVGYRLSDACRWLEFRVESVDLSAERAAFQCRVTAKEEGRPFFGFNRAKHAVLEAAILATRVGIVPAEEIRRELARLAVIVDKTAGDQEARAFQFLRDFLAEKLGD